MPANKNISFCKSLIQIGFNHETIDILIVKIHC